MHLPVVLTRLCCLLLGLLRVCRRSLLRRLSLCLLLLGLLCLLSLLLLRWLRLLAISLMLLPVRLKLLAMRLGLRCCGHGFRLRLVCRLRFRLCLAPAFS